MIEDKERIVCVGDAHTVTALRVAGIEGIIATADNIQHVMKTLCADKTCAVILVTRELAGLKQNMVRDLNREVRGPAVLEIPGIHSRGGSPVSVMTYINQALGIAL